MTRMIFVKNLKPFFALASVTIMNSSTSPKSRKNRRFQRFSNFASIEIEGQIFMTPQDFLENTVFDLPKPRIKRQVGSIFRGVTGRGAGAPPDFGRIEGAPHSRSDLPKM